MATHLLRLSLSLAGFMAFRHSAIWGMLFAISAYLASFALTHDLAHGALRLPRKLNEILLSLSALPMLVSGHSMRLMHLRHHARPLAMDDVEGEGAATTLRRSIVLGPSNAWRLRKEAWRAANQKQRRFIVMETLLSVALVACAWQWAAGKGWVATCVVFALTATAWASHLPHHPPALMKRIATSLAWTRSAVLLSFAFHQEHHEQPKVPCAELASEV